jgi:formyl-CoA transferase
MTARVFSAIGRADLIDDPRYRTNARACSTRWSSMPSSVPLSPRALSGERGLFEAAEVTIGPIYDTAQIVDPHFIARELIADYPDADMGQLPMHHVVPRLLGSPGSIRTRAPRLGEHNRALLTEIGIDERAYAALVADGVVRDGGASTSANS